MGVYIQGVNMPKQDELLQVRIYGDGKVSRVYDIECQQIGTAIETPNELVRCKDCLWYEPKYTDREYSCPQGLYGVYEDDFCSHAERREE